MEQITGLDITDLTGDTAPGANMQEGPAYTTYVSEVHAARQALRQRLRGHDLPIWLSGIRSSFGLFLLPQMCLEKVSGPKKSLDVSKTACYR